MCLQSTDYDTAKSALGPIANTKETPPPNEWNKALPQGPLGGPIGILVGVFRTVVFSKHYPFSVG